MYGIILLVILGAIVLWVIGIYNGLIKGRNRVEESWADIDVQLKRRYDLIPNIMEAVKGYAKHESGVFEKVTEARSKAMQSHGRAEQAEAENMLSETLKSLFAVSENYPELKASTNFMQLQDELSDTENKIQSARRFYNGNVRDFNTQLQVFPTNVVGNALGFKAKEYFELANEKEREAPKVSF